VRLHAESSPHARTQKGMDAGGRGGGGGAPRRGTWHGGDMVHKSAAYWSSLAAVMLPVCAATVEAELGLVATTLKNRVQAEAILVIGVSARWASSSSRGLWGW
jgi:hypothetical protein